ncbi:hypothetical protein CANINC_005009 [Pichia inconspicua]|uniref:Exocyst complex subunit Exo70 C-terminal domain-containing protein n=1 Tax=Pichia inconspicua TaxID=52247 RepID=A0A4T0WUL9_9ASCO|nr:hypothetical protein CANINC_005009 [[Candida] inconspicua]
MGADYVDFNADVDDMEIAILEENLRTMNDVCQNLSSHLTTLGRTNRSIVAGVSPLMKDINHLRAREHNLKLIEGKVGVVKDYASRVRKCLEALDVKKLNNINGIKQYIDALEKLDSINDELNSEGLGEFEGLRESIGEGILDGELALKATLLDKAKLAKLDVSTINEMRTIYVYLSDVRQMALEDLITRERQTVSKREVVSMKPIKPTFAKDQTYIYTGEYGQDIIIYGKKVEAVIAKEEEIVNELFKGLEASMISRIMSKIVRHINDVFVFEIRAYVEFIETRKKMYATMYYDLSSVCASMHNWLEQHGYSLGPLKDITERIVRESKNVFSDFFNYVKEEYKSTPNNGKSDSMNGTFMNVITRLSKLTTFSEQQLQCIGTMTINSWLPNELPTGFIQEKGTSSDPHFLLATFYTDVIEFSFFSLMSIYHNKSEEDVGVSLLFNMDGLQALLDANGSPLRAIIGSRGRERLKRLEKKAMDKAVSGWSTLTARLMQAATKQNNVLSMPPKELTKFKDDFATTFDTLCLQFQRREIPKYFKTKMVSDISATLIPSYRVFALAAGPKYTKLTVEELSARLATLNR